MQQERSGTLDTVPAVLHLDLATQQALVDALGEQLEGVADVEARLCGNLHVGRPELLGQLLGLLAAHCPLPVQVALLAHQHEQDGVGLHMLAHLGVPLLDMVKGFAVGHVKHQQASGRVAEIRAGHGPGGAEGDGEGET